MYSTCLFCNQSLGRNEVVESFPVGRRLAFDQRRGRLWVVCRKCARWNLTPLEERWEAIESCERFFHDSRKRISTENIGLAKLGEGLELIRIGEPLRPEFASWRYGDEFRHRFRRWMGGIVGGSMVYGGLFSAGVTGVFAGSVGLTAWIILHNARDLIRDRRVIARIRDDSGKEHRLRGADAFQSHLVPGDRRDEWALQLRVGFADRKLLVTGDAARRLASRVVPHINRFGGTRNQISKAVRDIEECGGADRFLTWAARNKPASFGSQAQWLGVEMALNEENERYALETELHYLEEAWKDAEELAAIADRLTIPTEVEMRFAKLRKKSTSDH